MHLHVADGFKLQHFSGKQKGVTGRELLGKILFNFANDFALITAPDAFDFQLTGFHDGADILPVPLDDPLIRWLVCPIVQFN